jgi:hypothetical protein
MGLLSNGIVQAWGDNSLGLCDVPLLPQGLSYVKIAAGHAHLAAIVSDGTIRAWGYNYYGECNVPPPPAGSRYIGVAAGAYHTVGLLSDGTVSAWGWNPLGECTIPPPPPGLRYVDVSAGYGLTVARLSDGSTLVCGRDDCNQHDLPRVPHGLCLVDVDTGGVHLAARIGWYGVSFCVGDESEAACPCSNGGLRGHGCQNSAATGGASLAGTGAPKLSADTVRFVCSGELPTSLSLLVQGSASITPASFGDGLRCLGGLLLRMYAQNAVGGVVTFPQPGDPSISARSAALLDPIPVGAPRNYQVLYRDSDASFCPEPQGGTFNSSNAIALTWGS